MNKELKNSGKGDFVTFLTNKEAPSCPTKVCCGPTEHNFVHVVAKSWFALDCIVYCTNCGIQIENLEINKGDKGVIGSIFNNE